MTFEEMRAEMRRKVIPENVIPQNITEYLMDDSAELPELDAFTFLNRLRSLGIGSADFQYLLEACNAPAQCVEKIKKNPAMNLQNLILTLENSGLTAKDYTVMLYTARQIWERTLTIRLEKTEDAAEDIEDIEENEDIEEEIHVPEAVGKQRTEPENPAPAAVGKQREEPVIPAEETDEDEDFDEPSLAEVLRQVRLLDKGEDYRGESDESVDYAKTAAQKAPEEPEIVYTEEPEDIEEIEEPAREVGGLTSDFSKIFDIIKENKHSAHEETAETDIPAESDYTVESEAVGEEPETTRTETMSVTKILAGMQKNAPEKPPVRDIFDDEDEETAEDDVEEVEDEAEISPDEDYSYDEQSDGSETAPLIEIDQTLFTKDRPVITREERDDDEYDDEDAEDEDYPEKTAKPSGKYHVKAIVAGAVGAAALAALAVFAGNFGTGKAPEMKFAENNDELFAKVFESYMPEDERFIGGGNISEYSDSCGIFGELLINKNGGMNFSDEKNVYCVTSENISCESFDGEILDTAKYILPPEKTSILTAFEQDGALYCIFSGNETGKSNECGYMKIKDGTVLFTVRQDGTLSDFSLDGGKISLGSVYVPRYSKSFSADDTDVYLPRVGKDEKKPLTAENVALSGTKGCSFAVCAEYTLDSGENVGAKAVLGDPVSAGADYKAAFNGKTDDGEYGLLVNFKDGITAKKCEKITAAAFGKDFAVTLEGENANLRTADFTAKCALSNLAEKAEKLKISGNSLLVGNKDGYFAAFDCGDISQPTALKLTKTNGIVSGDYAAVFSVDGGLEITLYKQNGEKADVLGKYTKTFTEDELKTLVLKGAETTAFAADSCGAAFEYFDGVSVVSQYVVFGRTEGSKTLYDDKTGFTRAFAAGGKIYAVSSKGFDCVTGKNT